MRWEADAACRGRDPAIFFPSDAGGVAAAKRICAGCPVVAECLEAHMGEVDGVWGGLSAQQRETMRRAQRRLVARLSHVPSLIHGTTTGYTRGCRCAHCRSAHTAYETSRRRRLEAAS